MSDFYDSLEEESTKGLKSHISDDSSGEEVTVPYYTGESNLGTILREGMQYKIPHRTIFTQSQPDDYTRPMSSHASTSSVCSFDVDSINDEMMNDETDEPTQNTTQRVKVMKKRKPKSNTKPKLSYLERFRIKTGVSEDETRTRPESGDSFSTYNQEKQSDSEECFYRELMRSDQAHLQSTMRSQVESLPDISESKNCQSMPDITAKSNSHLNLSKIPKPKSSSNGCNRVLTVPKQPKPDALSASMERMRRQKEYALAANSRNRLNFVKRKAMKIVEKETEDLKCVLIEEERNKQSSSSAISEDHDKLMEEENKSLYSKAQFHVMPERKPLHKKKERKSYLTTFAKQSVGAEVLDEATLKRMAERHEEDARMAEMIRREMALQAPDE